MNERFIFSFLLFIYILCGEEITVQVGLAKKNIEDRKSVSRFVVVFI